MAGGEGAEAAGTFEAEAFGALVEGEGHCLAFSRRRGFSGEVVVGGVAWGRKSAEERSILDGKGGGGVGGGI